MVVSDRKELMQTLRSYIEGQSPANLFTGKANLSDATDVINTLIDHRNFKELAKLWADGNAIDWAKLYSPVQRLSGLPCYPFAQERYWVSTSLPTLDRSAELSSVNEELSLKTKTLMFVKRLVAEQLSISPNEIDADQGFFEMGLSSLQLLKMTQEIKKNS